MADEGQEPRKGSKAQDAINRLAQRSAGLPDETPATAEGDRRAGMRLAGVCVQLAGSVVVAVLIGQYLDRKYGWGYAATLTLSMIALIGSLYSLIKEASKLR